MYSSQMRGKSAQSDENEAKDDILLTNNGIQREKMGLLGVRNRETTPSEGSSMFETDIKYIENYSTPGMDNQKTKMGNGEMTPSVSTRIPQLTTYSEGPRHHDRFGQPGSGN